MNLVNPSFLHGFCGRVAHMHCLHQVGRPVECVVYVLQLGRQSQIATRHVVSLLVLKTVDRGSQRLLSLS